MNREEKLKLLDATLLKIQKDHGKGSIRRLGDDSSLGVPMQSTGNVVIDAILGGGIGKGRITEIYGSESSGKTTLAAHIVAEVQKGGGIAAYIDAEHALDMSYLKNLGVDTDALLISQPDYGEQALTIAQNLIESSILDIVVIDSVSALVPKAELDGEMSEQQMGLQARMMSKALRKLTAIISKTNTCVIFINQIRMKIGVFFGSPETTSGGNALKFFASQRLDVRRTGSIKSGDEKTANTVKIKVVKNKIAPPFRECEVTLRFGEGIDSITSIIEVSIEKGIIDKSGAWYSYNGERLGQGKENTIQFIKNSPHLFKEIDKKVREILFSKKDEIVPETIPDEEDIVETTAEVIEEKQTKKRTRKEAKED